MKAKVFTITRRHWEEVKRNAEKAIEEIPITHNRVRAHKYSDAIAAGLSRHTKIREIEPVGRRCIWHHTVNIGTRKWSDYVREHTETTIEKQSKKNSDMFVLHCTNGYTENVTVIYR